MARGESLWVNVCVVGGIGTILAMLTRLATYQRMHAFGFIPDSWEAGLEPDHV